MPYTPPLQRRRACAAALAAALLIAGCQSENDEGQSQLSADELANRIEVLAVAKTDEEMMPQRLGTIAPGEVGLRFRGRPFCRLERNGRTLLIARGNVALVRVDAQLRVLGAGGPVLSSGGFFTGPGVTISVGRRGGVASRADAPGIAWPASVTVGGADKVPLQKLDAEWRCLG